MLRFLTVLFLLHISFNVFPQDYFNHKKNQNKNHLVIVHPTRSNLERYTFLLSNHILDPGKNKIVGLYFEDEEYDYTEVIRDYPEFGFHMVPGGLQPEDIYNENNATEEFRKVFRYSRGIIFNGGPDIPPSTYNAKARTITNVEDPNRHFYEISFLFHLVGGSRNNDFTPFLKTRPKYMVFGICLGMQSMNVAAGGTLIQDIPSDIYNQHTIDEIVSSDPDAMHRNYYSDYKLYPEIKSYYLHQIEFINGRWLNRKIRSSNSHPYVFSSHHQAIKDLGQDYRASATSMDGLIIEGIEHMKFPNVIGIQFHPEVDYLYKSDRSFRFTPGEDNFSLLEKIKELDSYEFHLELWKAVSGMIR